MKTYFFENQTFNTATSILTKLGYTTPFKTITKGTRTSMTFADGEAVFNERTGTLKLNKYED